ncbi:MAG: CotH kinase family protein [Dysgonamonadaceae bacterium]|jgi:hypothetical protein|nr:CotH kinase family protein [Dysgonamonadaceae bacterium]
MKRHLFFVILVFGRVGMFAGDIIGVGNEMFGIDAHLNIIVVNQDVNSINAAWTDKKEAIYLNELYLMESPVEYVQRGVAYPVTNYQGDRYTLYFTQLPLIFITSAKQIPDEPKIPAKFTIVESDGSKMTSDIGIETRGGWTQGFYAKKSYKITFREDDSGKNNKDVSLLGLRSDDDWDLQAMPNEPLRINEKTSFELWRKINTLHYQSSEAEAVNGCRMEYAELFLNEEYKGIYCVSEPIDRKQLQLGKYDEQKGIKGELYKSQGWGATVFSSCPPYDNNSFLWINLDGYGYENKYPKEVPPDWEDLYDFVYLVLDGSDSRFYAQYQSYFNIENVTDYFILLNVARARDNTGNNLFVARYNAGEPYFYVPWDFDGSFGNEWDGSKNAGTTDILTNGFYARLLKDYSENGFIQRLQTKWELLRKDCLTASNLTDMFRENYHYLKENGVYEREESVWKTKDGYRFDSQYAEYMQDWITERLLFLDNEFNDYRAIVPKTCIQKMQYPCDVRIYNANGQLIKTFRSVHSENEISYHELNRGIYFIRFQSNDSYRAGKIVVR